MTSVIFITQMSVCVAVICTCTYHRCSLFFFFIAECIIALYWTCYHFLCGIYLVEAGFLEFHLLFSSLH